MKLQEVHEATAALAAARTPEDIARVATTIGASALGATSAAVWLRGNDALRMSSSIHIAEDYIGRFHSLAIDRSTPPGIVAMTREPLWIETMDEFRTLVPDVYAGAVAAGRGLAFCMLPFLVEGEVAAVAGFTYEAPHQFNDDERHYLLAFAHAAGLAIDRARLYVAADEASRSKDAFLAMLGHELRNPLSPIVSAIELIKLRHDGSFDRELAMIDKHMSKLRRLVDDLLDVSRIVRGRIELHREPVALAEAVDDAIEALGDLLEGRKHVIDIQVAPTVRVDADRERLVQILRHLVMNAAAFTPSGGRIDIAARDADGMWVIEVRDNGRGIERELLPHVFEMFTQQQQASDRADGGLGLGLAIVKNLVELHAGTVAIASDGPGLGTAVTVRWPQAAV